MPWIKVLPGNAILIGLPLLSIPMSTNKKAPVLFIVGIGLFILLIVVPNFFIAFVGRADGQHQGFVTAVETTGIVFNVDSVYVKTDLATTQEDKYCVTDPAVRAQLDEAVKSKRPVTLKYHNDLVVFAWDCSAYASSIIVGVE